MRSPLLLLAVVAVMAAAHGAHAASTRRHRRDADDAVGLAAAPASASLDAEVFGADPGQRTDREKRLLLEHKVQIGNHVKNAVLNLIFGKINTVIDHHSALVGVFERANAAKNLALLGPGTKRPPAGLGIKGLLGGVLSSSLGSSSGSSLPSLTGLSGGSSGGSGGGGGGDSSSDFGGSASLGIGGSVGGGTSSSSSSSSSSGGPTTDNIPTFEGNRVSLEIPEQLFGSSFTLVTNISQILGDVILNTARRVQRFVEALKPKFRGLFGVPADAAAAARKRATDDEVARGRQAAAAASDQEDLADNQADPRDVARASAAGSSSRTSSSSPSASGRTEAFKSLTGLEPFDFDFAALDKLVQSGDGKAVRTVDPSAAASDLRGAVVQAGDILSTNLKRMPVGV